MSDVHGAQSADDLALEADGLTPEERVQFNSMQSADDGVDHAAGGDNGASSDAGTGGDAGAAAAGAAADAGAGGDDAGKVAAAAAAKVAGVDPAADAGDDEDEGDDAPEGQPQIDPATGQRRRKPPRVSGRKYADVLARAEKAEQAATVERERMARADERLRIINEALTTPKAKSPEEIAAAEAEADPMPDKMNDVFAYLDWQDRQRVKERTRFENEIKELRDGRSVDQSERELGETYMADARQFAGTEPNFIPAYTYLMGTRLTQLALHHYGIDLTEDGAALDATQMQRCKRDIAQEERDIVAGALRQKKSPAKALYQMARATGFRPEAAAQNGAGGNDAAAAAGAAAANGAAKPRANGAAKPGNGAAAARPNGNGVDVTAEIARIAAGQEASLSLSNGGGAPNNPMTAARLADMPQAEFDRLVENMSPEEWERLVAGSP